ncbi:hypothetical protein FB107DRAFT_267281 [Schizophyllum commune]
MANNPPGGAISAVQGASAAPAASALGRPPSAAAYSADHLVYYNKETATWRFEDDDGNEMEYDATKGSWVPVLDDDLIKRHQAAYSVAGVDENAPAAPVLKRESKKRKEVDYTSATVPDEGPSKKKKKDVERKSKNTSVYVTGLPSDTDSDEIVARFSKCGVLEEDDEGDPKVKMYAREDGTFNGEALVSYFKEDSVLLALNILDDAELRIGDPSTRMSVSKADFSAKGNAGQSGDKPRKTVDKKKATRRIGKMQKKIDEWKDEDGFGPQLEVQDTKPMSNRNNRVVVLKHMFTLEELEKDATLLLDLKEEVREEAETLGEVTNVVLYDKEPEGVMTIKFREPLSAQACIIKMNGRFFDGRRVEAYLYDGRQRFRRSNAADDIDGTGDEAEKRRLANFEEWLLNEGD